MRHPIFSGRIYTAMAGGRYTAAGRTEMRAALRHCGLASLVKLAALTTIT